MKDRIEINIENHIAHVEMIRADKMNALDGDMMDALIAAGESLQDNKDVRAIVLSGRGKAFCAGLDKSNFESMASPISGGGGDTDAAASDTGGKRRKLIERTNGVANRAQKTAWIWRELQAPVIMAAQGFALGGGFQIFMGADIRYAAPDTRFSIMEIRWGLVPDMGTTHVMARVAREDIVKELALTGRIFEAPEALAHGFLTRITDDPVAHALETAKYIAGRNPAAVRGIKRLFNEPADKFATDTLLLESALQDPIIGSAEQREAVMAELEGRPANYN
ncbi:MAG: crotonase/enoyl-CoA hydratase family protein [Alphaproteobacteria bacterium]|nr:crotonase/enoyl-CoA hydratase family protein [Alphaproteobacteria bacterium]